MSADIPLADSQDASMHVASDTFTVLDSDDEPAHDSMHVAPRADPDAAPIHVVPKYIDPIFTYWTSRTNNFAKLWSDVNLDASLSFQLSSEVNNSDIMTHQVEHCHHVISALLVVGYIEKFKVGISHEPVRRYRDPSYGYAKDGYHALIILVVSDMPDFVMTVERALIRVYRRYDRAGHVTNAGGHPLCANRAEGGESGEHGISPFCCYLSIKFITV